MPVNFDGPGGPGSAPSIAQGYVRWRSRRGIERSVYKFAADLLLGGRVIFHADKTNR